MSSSPLIVLKFGGSVLIDEKSLRVAGHEIYRWRRDGYRVIAVVSAFAGATDALVAKAHALSHQPLAHAKAAIVAIGETQSAATLGVCLDGAGIPATVFTPGAVQLRAIGDALDAAPVSVDTAPIEHALDRDGVVVIPGFIAIDDAGRTVTLGRGGSDLTALFLAHALGADRCRLIKDVGGLYERDPAGPGPKPRRYDRISYDDAMLLDGSILQRKAVRFASSHKLIFEVASFNATDQTVVSCASSVLTSYATEHAPTRVALLGLGTVGASVLEMLNQMRDKFDIVAASAKNPHCHAEKPIDQNILSDDPVATALADVDVVVEVIGGTTVAYEAVKAALRNGTHVVTANKALIAAFGRTLREIAGNSGAAIFSSASVGGAVPVLEYIRTKPIKLVCGVLNGTTNYVLNQLVAGIDFDTAIADTQQNGFAESNPSRDLDGTDAMDKLRVIAQAIGLDADDIHVTRQQPVHDAMQQLHSRDSALRHVASLTRDGELRVHLEHVGPGDPLYDIPGAWNVVEIEYEDGSSVVLRGKGAGSLPTAESVVADLLELRRNLVKSTQSEYVKPGREVICAV